MKYVSTRGQAPELSFEETLQAGLARDGGLYVPESWPQLSHDEIASFAGRPYAETAYTVIKPFVGGTIADDILRQMCEEAYGRFSHPAVAPLVQLDDNHYLLELFHGPTLAFKDVAMQLLSRMMDYILGRQEKKVTIVGATSGDTGGAAIEAFRGRENVDIFILFPNGRVSPFQQRQMTTAGEANVHAIAVEGTFDDCQALVKSMFNHLHFRDSVALSAVNSINWGRILAQIVYYMTSACNLGAPDRAAHFVVPTGNFGNIFAGYVAQKMGLPVAGFTIATNINDILARTLTTGRYEIDKVFATRSPSMDIQVSSNFERLLFEAEGRSSDAVLHQMNGLKQSGNFSIDKDALDTIQSEFSAIRISEEDCVETIRKYHGKAGYLLDPHSAIGVVAGEMTTNNQGPVITLATAHPAKFASAVTEAINEEPIVPAHAEDLSNKKEHMTILANDQAIIEEFITSHSRATNQMAAS